MTLDVIDEQTRIGQQSYNPEGQRLNARIAIFCLKSMTTSMSLRLSLPSKTQLHFIIFENRDFVDIGLLKEDIGISMNARIHIQVINVNYILNETTGSGRKLRLL